MTRHLTDIGLCLIGYATLTVYAVAHDVGVLALALEERVHDRLLSREIEEVLRNADPAEILERG